MKILFDQNVPRKLRRSLSGHLVSTAHAMNWDRLTNGTLLAAAEAEGYDLFLTCDQNLSYQQNLSRRRIAILELTSNNWPVVEMHLLEIQAAVTSCSSGSYARVVCGG